MREDVGSFEAALAELEGIVESLDREELALEEALALFERGVTRLREASRILDEARGRIDEVVEGASGELRLIGFDLETEASERGDERGRGS